MANLQWDHTVHYVNDLEAAIKKFNDVGLIAFEGGSHTHWGTHNALSYFDLCYIEFLGVEDRELAESIDNPHEVIKDAVQLLPEQEVLSRVALRTDDIGAVASNLEAFHLELSPIMDGKRLDAQGNLIEWKMMTISGEFQGVPYPFIIQWKGTNQERRKKLTETGIIQQHPAGDILIKQAVFHTQNPVAVARHWQEVFRLPIVQEDETKAIIRIDKQEFVFQKGEENQLKQVVFDTDVSELKGKTFYIGQGEYVF